MASFYTFRLKAGVEFQAPVSGKLILVDDIGAADGIDITSMIANAAGRTMPNRKKAFKCWTDYDALILRAPVDCTVAMFLSDKDVSLGFADGALVNVVGEVNIGNNVASRVPVDIAGGNVELTATNVAINNDDSTAIPVRQKTGKTVANLPSVVVGTGAAVLLVSDESLMRLRIRNASDAATVAIGGEGVTMDTAAIQLTPGAMWIEDVAPGAAWYAVADTDETKVQLQGIKE